MPFNHFGSSLDINTVYRERPRDVAVVEQIERNKLKGRVRTSGAIARTPPSSATDVVDDDAEGDVLYDATYQYRLVRLPDDSLVWDRKTLAISW